MALLRRLQGAWRSILRVIGLAWVRYQVQVAGSAESYRRICYVAEKKQLLDQLILEDLCVTRGWARPFDPIPNTLGLDQDAFIGLRNLKGLLVRRMVPGGDDQLRELVNWLEERPQADIQLVPVSVYWGRAPGRERSWLKLLLAEEWGTAGRMRRFFRVLFHGRHVLLKVSEPVSLRRLVDEDLGAERTVRKTARLLRIHFRRLRGATLGPDLSHKRLLAAQILQSDTVRQAVSREVSTGKRSERRAQKIARKYLYEIAADYSYPMVRVLERALSKLWNSLYDGVDVYHLDSVEEIAPGNEIVYVPCHRSHIDYLLLSYVIYQRGLALPHIAAGVNLNMPLVGGILRRGGAFFIRRSFKGQALYSAVFRAYLAAILSRGFPVEYFVEGTRSRTGRLLQPKGGLLSMTVDSFLAGPSRPLVFVPVFFGYEKLIEGSTFIGELQGKDKNKETLGGLLRSIGALRGEFGRVQVSFGSPIDLAAHFDEVAPGWRDTPRDEPFRPDWFNEAVGQLGRRIMVGINQTAVVNTTGLVALVMLAMPKQAAVEAELFGQIRLYQRLLAAVPYSVRTGLTDTTPQEIVAQAERMGWLQRRRHALGDVLSMSERQAVLASYYRNTLLHLLALPALIACAVVNRPDQSRGSLKETIKTAFPLMRAELFLSVDDAELDEAIDQQLAAMATLGLLRLQPLGDRVMAPDQGAGRAAQLELLAQITMPFVERYYLGAALLLAVGPSRWGREELINRSRQAAEHLALIYSLNSPDLFAKDLFKTFVATLHNLNVIDLDDEGKLIFSESLERLAHGLNRMLPPRESRTVWQFARANSDQDLSMRSDPE